MCEKSIKTANLELSINDSSKCSTAEGSGWNSDIYNTSTLMQFSNCRAGMPDQQNSFLQVYYRKKNIALVNAFENCSYSTHPHIKKTCKGLSCCSYLSEIEVDKNKDASVFRTSGKCFRQACPRCNQIRASKFKKRFLNAYNDE